MCSTTCDQNGLNNNLFISSLELSMDRLPVIQVIIRNTFLTLKLADVKEQNRILGKRVTETQSKLEKYEHQLSDMRIQLKREKEREQIVQAQLDGAMQVSCFHLLIYLIFLM